MCQNYRVLTSEMVKLGSGEKFLNKTFCSRIMNKTHGYVWIYVCWPRNIDLWPFICANPAYGDIHMPAALTHIYVTTGIIPKMASV